jgi:hypothetical protein
VTAAQFAILNSLAHRGFGCKDPAYEIQLLWEHDGLVVSSSGIPVDTRRFHHGEFDTIMVTGTMNLYLAAARWRWRASPRRYKR